MFIIKLYSIQNGQKYILKAFVCQVIILIFRALFFIGLGDFDKLNLAISYIELYFLMRFRFQWINILQNRFE